MLLNEQDLAKQSQVTLANAAELTTAVILNVVGNDISDSINGTLVGGGLITNIVQARIQKSLKLN